MGEEGGEILEMRRRRSARIWALEEEKEKKKKKKKEEEEEQKACATKSNAQMMMMMMIGVPHSEDCEVEERRLGRPPTVRQYDRRRVRKRKRLEDVVVTSLAYPSQVQEGQNQIKHASIKIGIDQLPTSSSLQRIPQVRVLEFVLDILQRRDTLEIFAQPVDPQEVEGYYRIIKEPMDFGTMRAKLQEGMYTSLEQFEHDVFLISNNALHFNSSTTIYYREARAIQELAHRVFHALRSDPENFELEFSQTRRRPGRKPLGEPTGTKLVRCGRVNTCVSPKRNTKTGRPFTSVPHFDQTEKKVPSGSGDGFETERRRTYRPWTSYSNENDSIVSSLYSAPKPLFHINHEDLGYKESLMRFVKDLGPTAQMVANKKLAKYLQIEASNCQSQTPTLLANTPNCLPPAPSLTQAPAYLDGVNNGAYKGKMACIDSTSIRDMVPSSDIMGICGNPQRENAYFNNITDVKIGSSGEIAANARENMDIYTLSKGKMICTDDNMDLHGNGRYDTNQNQNRAIWLGAHSPLIGNENINSPAGNGRYDTNQNQNRAIWLGAHSPLTGNENINSPAGNGNTNICSKNKPTDMVAAELQSRLLELMCRSNNYSDTSFLPPQASKLLGQATTSMHGLGSQNEGGANSAQAAQSLKWSRPTLQQAICDFPNVQMQLNKDKLFGQGTVLQQALHIETAHKMALLHAMSFYDKATPESHQAEASAQCFQGIQGQSLTDTKQLDLALQL